VLVRSRGNGNVARPVRLQRSELAVPATSTHFFGKAADGPADAIFLDLEDAVSPSRKVEARALAIRSLREVDWGRKTMAVRINALDTVWGVRDLIEIVANAPRVDLVLIPKVGAGEDVRFVERVLAAVEKEAGPREPIGIEVLIETARGVSHADEIAASSERLEAMIFGVGDYTVDMRTDDTVFGQPNPSYAVESKYDDGSVVRHVNDQWHFALAKIANACRAEGLRPIDGPFTDFHDPAGYEASARRASALGYEGKWAIHPSQIDVANRVFSPSAERVRWAHDTIEALRRSEEQGRGAVAVDGVLVDFAHGKIARHVVERAHAIASLEGASQ
jgi:malyl-CoA/(S)-citramalyl-CoA lyase